MVVLKDVLNFASMRAMKDVMNSLGFVSMIVLMAVMVQHAAADAEVGCMYRVCGACCC
jgi:hypothetical protein